MNKEVQEELLWMMERVTEPLYYGTRGNHNMAFNVPMDNLSEKERDASAAILQATKPGGTFNLAKPKDMPDLTTVAMNCPKEAIFSYFLPAHREAAAQLSQTLKDQSSAKEFVSAAAVARDSPMINTQLWVHSTIKAALERPDLRGVRFPALWEIMPDLFITPAVRMAATKQAAMPEKDRSVVALNDSNTLNGVVRSGSKSNPVVVDKSFAGRSENPENKMTYFREDLGVASHHWHWHIIYSGNNPKGLRNRRGELFYYMHHGMLARYDSDRLCNGLPRTRIFDVSGGGVLEEGYFPKLTAENSGRIWGGRQARTVLSNVHRVEPTGVTKVDIDDLRKWKDRILDAIDTGIVMEKDPVTKALKRIPLTVENGTNLLGDIIENGGNSAPNPDFYGNLHNMGHVIIGYSNDPEWHHNENIGAMGSEATAMKDPSFYRWHKFIDSLFEKYKDTLDPYTEDELVFRGVRAKGIEVKTLTPGVNSKNILLTHWMQSDIDLSRGLDIGRRSSMGQGSVWARFTHLNHHPFEYTITVDSTRANVESTVRIFMAPHLNEHGDPFMFAQQRLLFFEMDKFTHTLNKGQNVIKRRSEESTVTIPWEQSFRDLEKLNDTTQSLSASNATCGCGWPQHLLLPKGNEGGALFDLVVMITDATIDLKEVPDRRFQPKCKESISFCGILDEKYPDSRAMGFPFDRKPRRTGGTMGMEVPFLKDFIPADANMASTQVRIVFRNETLVRSGSATEGMDVLPPPSLARENPNRGGPVDFNNPPRRARQGNEGTWGYPHDGGNWRDSRGYDSSPERF